MRTDGQVGVWDGYIRGGIRGSQKMVLVRDLSWYKVTYGYIKKDVRVSKKGEVVRFVSYNIWNGRNGVL